MRKVKVKSQTQRSSYVVDTGKVITGEKTIEEMGTEILDYIIDLASGRKTAKAMDLEQYDFIPWKRGVSL